MAARRLAVLCGLLGAASCASSAPLGWAHSYTFSEVLQQASASDRLILLEIFGDHCPPCRDMERTLMREEVAAELGHFIKLRYHVGQTKGEDLVRRYELGGYPHLLAIDGTGRLIDRTGAVSASAMIAWLRQMREIARACAQEDQLARKPNDLALRLRVGSAWARRGRRARAELHLRRVLAEDDDNAKGYGARALLALAQHLYLRQLNDLVAAERTLRRLRTQFPRAAAADEAGALLAQAVYKQGRRPEALLILEQSARSAEGHNRAATLLHWWDMLGPGIRHARKAVRMRPEQARYWVTLAFLQHKAKREQEALDSLSRAIRLEPHNETYGELRRYMQRAQ